MPRWSPAVVIAATLWGIWLCLHTYTRSFASEIALLDHPLGHVAFASEAGVRAVRGVVAASLVLLAAWQAGRLSTAGADDLFAGALERIVIQLSIGVTLLGAAFTALGQAGIYRPWSVTALVSALAASAAWRGASSVHGPGAVPRILAAVVRRASTILREKLPWSACAGAGLMVAFVAALAPEVEYDALWYHLWLPREALAAGAPVDRVEEYIALYPLGWEVLNGAALVIGGSIGAKLLHFACLPLTGAVAAALARALVPRRPRGLVFALCVGTPTALWEASTAYVDLALTWLIGAFVLALVRFDETRDRRWLAIAAVALGGAMATKHLALVAAAAALPVFVVSQAWRAQGVATWFRAVAAGAFIGVLAIGLASPWYLRAWRQASNPVFPEQYALFGASPPDRWSAESQASLDRFKARFGTGRGPFELLALPWNVTTHGARFAGLPGPLFLAFAPFALLRANRRGVALALGALVYVAVWASPLGSFQLRFLLPLVPLAAVAAAVGVSVVHGHAAQCHRVAGTAVRVVVVVLLLLNLPMFSVLQERDRRGPDGWLTHVLRALPAAVVVGAESEDAYLARLVPAYRAWKAIDAATPRDARVLTFAGGDYFYSHRARVSSDAPVALPATWHALKGDETAARLALDRLGITHVLADRRVATSVDGRNLAIFSADMQRCCLRPIYADERFTVYERPLTVDRTGLREP